MRRTENRWLSFVVLPLVLAVALVLLTRLNDQGPILSPANIGLGPGHAAAAPDTAEPAPDKPADKAASRTDGPTATTPTPTAAAKKVPTPASADHGDYDLRHAPTVDAATIARVLRGYGSPAVGAAETMYRLGVEYGIDPAYCLAFFIHESTAGTAGVARVTKSVGNIRHTPGYRNYEGYRHYDSWEEGIEDWYKLISGLYIDGWGLTTVDAIIPVYAPSSDGNNPAGYAATVKKLVAGWRNGR